ncbi:hypothetical protein SAMN05421823_101642 [Catalinimonas alkaloidigena]|uniref:HTTM-like domain-containing protein n=1 Tax=Catalinimonas alkaloidigena TaxID=1075417 RepID=A0A1G8YDS0_9BACT|nr:hypothetical protein [Catalinimonas alkaloidigena]SDK00876.1 hypothetical protein SAMN05421823_101642 [Catalinimonas alkaloidigena]
MNTWKERLSNYFFSETRVNTLGILRFFLCIGIVRQVYARSRNMLNLELTDGTYDLPPIAHLLPFPSIENAAQFEIFYLLLTASLFMAAVGFLTRFNLIFSGLGSIYVSAILYSVGFFDHEMAPISQILLILAFAPGSLSFSVDRLLLYFFKKDVRQKTDVLTYFADMHASLWGKRLILLLLAVVYLSAGLSKFRYTGFKWLDGQTLGYYLSEEPRAANEDRQLFYGQNTITEEHKWKDGFGMHAHTYGNYQTSNFWNEVGLYLSDHPFLMMLLSIMAVSTELALFFIILGKWYQNALLVLAYMLHTGIGLLMGLDFGTYRILIIFLLDWELIFDFVLKKSALARRTFEGLVSLKLKYFS